VSAVSYQSILGGPLGARQQSTTFVALPEDAIATRRKEATRTVSTAVSRRQARWLREVAGVSGKGIDEAAVVRALVDLGMQLDVEWELLAGGAAVREAVRRSVRVARPDAP